MEPPRRINVETLDLLLDCWDVVSFYDENDINIIDITISNIQTGIIIDYVVENHENISVYQPNLSTLIVPSKKKLYEAIYLDE